MHGRDSKSAFYKRNLHWFTVALLSVLLTCIVFNNSYWKSNRVIVWDVYGYTQYLSAGFIYNDLRDPEELMFIDSAYRPTGGMLHYGRHCVDDTCTAVAFKYTMGNAVMMAPFYLTAHAVTKNSNEYPADGYSRPYQLAIVMSTLFWAVCGMLVLAVLLSRWFSPVVTSITLLLVATGTNYLYYASLESGMTHIPTFFCLSAAVLSLLLWLEKRSWLYAFIFGVVTGLIALIRLPDMVFGIIPALLLVKALTAANKQQRIQLLLQAAFVGFVIVLVFSPQMLYWKYVSGHWFFYSYKGERFIFSDPHIVDGLFSYKKGWLLYTPVMLFALAGIAILIKKVPWLGIGIIAFIAINIYVLFSWEMWWYGGSFGARCMIQSYAVLAIPLAFFIEWLTQLLSQNGMRKIPGVVVSVVLVFFMALNLFQTYQYKRGTLHYDSMTKKAYWGIFGKLMLTKEEYDQCYGQ